jgi:acyl-CoA reductase-like NAD-dependent aldehyde dehydrogenase
MSNYKLLIDGKLVGANTEFAVINPATGNSFTNVPHASREQCEQAINAAKIAYPAWSEKTIIERRSLIIALADKVKENSEKLALSLVMEQGKPLAEAQMEVLYAEIFIRTQAEFDLDMKVIEENDDRRVEEHCKPLGVVAGIIPWNFPLLVATFKLPPALLAGNTIVIKPAPTTPVTTLMLGELCAEIFPKGVVNIITDQNELGPVLSSHPDIAKVSVTGSTVTGKKVMASAAETIKRVTLELGGNDAAIVLDDLDPILMAEKIIAGAFLNAGQVCIAIKRLYVSDKIYDQLLEELAKHIKNLVLGNGLDTGVNIGPVQNEKQFQQAKELLIDAEKNARIVVGGEAIDSTGYFIQPTLVADAKDGTRLVDEEQFSPILPVIRYHNLEDAIKSANGLNFGLGASVWSSDVTRAYEVAKRLEAGTVWINKHLDFGPTIPLCGAKQSGLGKEFAQEGLKEYTQTCVINIAK